MSKVQREPAAHHLLIIHTIEKLLRHELDKTRVMILMPPGSAKSTYTSQMLPAWFCNPEQFPRDLILACSYAYTLIEDFGKIARDMVEEESKILGISISQSAAAAGNWRTNLGGGFFCGGVGAGIAGRRGKLGLIDDYLGSEEDADSDVIRNKHWKWYWNDFQPRLLPNAFQFLIANRRHEDDLVGRLLNSRSAKDWLVIRLPMLAEENDPLGRKPGERLWPEWFTQEQVDDAKTNPRTWGGLYQQRPTPEEGGYFKKDHIVKYRPADLPSDLRIYVGSDFAVRKGEDSDRFCFLPAGVDSNGRLWILPDWFWTRTDTGDAVEQMLALAKRRKPICWWAGRENITGSIAPFLYKRMQETNTYIPIEELSESRDKEQKSQSIKARMSAKMVMFPEYAPGWEEAEHELLTFPGGLHDDFVDALAKLGQGLAKMTPASIKPHSQSVDEVLNQKLTCGWVERSHNRRNREKSRVLEI